MTMNRRGFLGRLLGGVAAAVIAPQLLVDPERELWVPGAKTIVLPPAGGWVTADFTPTTWRRRLKVELFADSAGFYDSGFNPAAWANTGTLVSVKNRIYRVDELQMRHEMRQLYSAHQSPVAMARGCVRMEATLIEVHGGDYATTPPPLKNYIPLEETAEIMNPHEHFQTITARGMHLPDDPVDIMVHPQCDEANYQYTRESRRDYHDRMGFDDGLWTVGGDSDSLIEDI